MELENGTVHLDVTDSETRIGQLTFSIRVKNQFLSGNATLEESVKFAREIVRLANLAERRQMVEQAAYRQTKMAIDESVSNGGDDVIDAEFRIVDADPAEMLTINTSSSQDEIDCETA